MFGFVTSRPRLFAGLVVGCLTFPLLPHAWSGQARFLVAWDLAIIVYIVAAGVLFFSEHLDKIAGNARAQEEGEWTIFAITVAVVLASFVAIFGEFSNTKDLHGAAKSWHIALVAVTLLSSWLMLHTTFCFRYAHEYYTSSGRDGHFDGGLDFPEEKRPDYLDFTYFSLVLGMTFQVSDVQITSRKLRRLAVLHGLLSFLFNTIIIALTVNIGASLL